MLQTYSEHILERSTVNRAAFKQADRTGDADLKRKVGVLLLLPHLEARQVGVPQDEFVLVLEVLCYCAFNSLAVLLLQREPKHQSIDGSRRSTEGCVRALSKFGLRLMAGGSPGHVTHSVLSLHLPTVSDLHL